MKLKKIIIFELFIMIFAVSLYGQSNALKPLEINSFPEFFDNIHIGMKSEDVIKALDNRFFLAPASNSITGYNNIEIFRNNTSVIINYKNSKYKSGYLFYSDILFQIGIFKSQEIYKDKTRGEKTEYNDFEIVKNDFQKDKRYENILEEKKVPKDIGNRISLIEYWSVYKNNDKVILIIFSEEVFDEKYSNVLKENTLFIYQVPYLLHIGDKTKQEVAIEQFVNTYLKQ